jgi:hypothetical protein
MKELRSTIEAAQGQVTEDALAHSLLKQSGVILLDWRRVADATRLPASVRVSIILSLSVFGSCAPIPQLSGR